MLYDMHCHLGFSADAVALSRELAAGDVKSFSTTVAPREYGQISRKLMAFDSVRVGLGLHPWWLSAAASPLVVDSVPSAGNLSAVGGMPAAFLDASSTPERMLEEFLALLPHVNYVGEIGLDFSPRWTFAKEEQLRVFRVVAHACAQEGGKLLSLHAVRSVEAVLDALKQARTLRDNDIVLHWFSGSSEQLRQAIKLGCYFSVGEKLLQTKRGQAFVQAIPAGQLLLETDAPSLSEERQAQEFVVSLKKTLGQIDSLRKESIAHVIENTSVRLLQR